MSDPIMDEIERRFQPVLKKLAYLRDRWHDEQLYEDWNDYVLAMQEITPADTEFVNATKRPFGFEVRTKQGMGVRFFATATETGFDTFKPLPNSENQQ